MLNLNFNCSYQYEPAELKHLKSLRLKYGRKYQKQYGLSKKRVWYDGEVKSLSIKHNIVRSLLTGSRFRCAYCTKRLVANDKPIDHFIPNSDFPEYSFHSLNLVPSCGYCNSSLKKTFNPLLTQAKKYSRNTFLIVHPILHNVDNHIVFDAFDSTLIDFERCSIEGLMTIELFHLHTFEMLEQRINQAIIEQYNPLSDISLIKLVNECATYQVKT